MIKAFIFILKYKILKDPINLSYHPKEFFQLSKSNQRKVLDKYFNKLENNFSIASYFDTKEARYYDNHQEITFFNSYYFDKLIIEHDINNLKLIDKFKIKENKIEYLIQYSLELIKENHLKLKVDELLNYSDSIPLKLSKSIDFMDYLIDENCYNIKYLTYNEEIPAKQRELIIKAINLAKKREFNIENYLQRDKTIPSILKNNLDFLLYLIENNIENTKYLTEKLLENQTITNKEKIINTIITSLEKDPIKIKYIEQNQTLAMFLNRNETYITYIISNNLENIQYIDWHNLTDGPRNKIINKVTSILTTQNLSFNIMKYPFRELFFENYNFMKYLLEKDFRWIAITKINSKEENEKLIQLFFQEISKKKYKFKLEDFLEDGTYINHNLIENKKILHYLFINQVPIVQHINFFHLKSSRTVVENIINELEKMPPEYEFQNEDYLINGKYPIPLSNSYRFMRYVIDKNFNHIAYIDTSMIDKRELKRIINYAFRMVYYIRGENKKLNFDLDGYFKDSDMIHDEYFQECLKSL